LAKLKRLDRHVFWSGLGSQAIQDIVERIERGCKLFFESRRKGLKGSVPGFKRVRVYRSFTLRQAGWKLLDGDRVRLMGMAYKYSKSRDITGDVKTAAVKKAAACGWLFVGTGEYFKPGPAMPGNSGGSGFGLKLFLARDAGGRSESPLRMSRASKVIKALSRKVSRKRKGAKGGPWAPESDGRRKARLALARAHIAITDKRRDFHFKTALALARELAALAVDDLNLKGMRRMRGREISDSGHGGFLRILAWECLKNGRRLAKAGRWLPSSKACSGCGHALAELDLKTRFWMCPVCGAAHDRDVNAAINIARAVASALGAGAARPAA
jgi:putative transposase